MNETVTRVLRAKRGDLELLCRKYHVSKLAVFGSGLGDDFGQESDLDLIVEFEPGHIPGFGFARLQRELSNITGLRVDLHTRRNLSRYFRDEVERGSQIIYEADVARLWQSKDAG